MSGSQTQKPVPLRGNERFRLDRTALAASLAAEGEEDEGYGLEHFGDSPAEQVAGAVLHAEDAKALHAPDGVEVYVLKLTPEANGVILALRQTHEAAAPKLAAREAAGLPTERQLASWTLEPNELSEGQTRTFGGLCETLEEAFGIASELLPSLRALLEGEQQLLDLISEPLTVLSYDHRARLSDYRAGVEEITQGDPDSTRDLWPLLIEALECGEASEDWDGDRQRAFRLERGGEPHLARQLIEVRAALVNAGGLPADALPDPTGGFDSYLA